MNLCFMHVISGMKVIDPVKYRRIYEDVMKKLDKLENEFLPQVTFTFHAFNGRKVENVYQSMSSNRITFL